MAYAENGRSEKNLENSLEIFSLVGKHNAWLANFYTDEMTNAFRTINAYSTMVARNMGSLSGSLAKAYMGNVAVANKIVMGMYANRETQIEEKPTEVAAAVEYNKIAEPDQEISEPLVAKVSQAN